MSSVNDFVSNFTIGARANLYEVNLTKLGSNLKFVCKAVKNASFSILGTA